MFIYTKNPNKAIPDEIPIPFQQNKQFMIRAAAICHPTPPLRCQIQRPQTPMPSSVAAADQPTNNLVPIHKTSVNDDEKIEVEEQKNSQGSAPLNHRKGSFISREIYVVTHYSRGFFLALGIADIFNVFPLTVVSGPGFTLLSHER